MSSRITEEAGKKVKLAEEDIYDKWYIRYAGAVFMLIMALVSFVSYIEGIQHRGLGLLLFNPVMGMISSLAAITLAWELSCIVITLAALCGIIYGLFLIIKIFPVSVALILGAIIIALAVKSR